MAAVESEADDKFANIDLEALLSRVARRPLTLDKLRSINKAPEFEKRLTGEETVHEGSTVQLETKVSGFPRPVLRWFKEDVEIVDHPRIHVESDDSGVFVFTLEYVNKGDEAAYKCRAENEEGVSSCMFYLHVKVKSKSTKKSGRQLTKRTVSYPPMFPTIVEKVEEEEKAAHETARSPPSPLTQLYDGLTLQTRHTWPKFLGDWAYVENAHRNGGSLGSESESETGDGHSLDSIEHDEVFSEESGEKSSSEGSSAAFYLSSEDATPGTPDCFNGGVKEMSDDSLNETGLNGNETGSNGTEVCQNETLSNRNEIGSTETENKFSGVQTVFNDNEIPTTRGVTGFNEMVSTGREIGSPGLDNAPANVNRDIVIETDKRKIPARVSESEKTLKSEPNNNDAKVHQSKKGLHLPLANGSASTEVKEKGNEEKVKKKKEKDSSVKKSEERKISDKVKLLKKTTNTDKEKADKPTKKTEKDKETQEKGTKESSGKRKSEKEGSSPKKGEHKEGSSPKKGEQKEPSSKSTKKTDNKEEKSKSKSKDKTKSPPTEKKSSKKSELKDKKIDSPKRKSESKEKQTCDYINNPDPPILGSARPLVFTNFASKLGTNISPVKSSEARGDYSHEKPEVCQKVTADKKGSNSGDVRYHDNLGLALVPSPLGEVPFGRYFEEFIFVVCLFTFLSLCIGIPSETFVLVILGMHFFYSMVTIFGLC